MDVGEPRVVGHEDATQGLVEGVDRTVALADGNEALSIDPELDGGLGVDGGPGALCRRRTVVGRGPVALDGEVGLHPPRRRPHQQLQAGVGSFEHVALGLQPLQVLGEETGGAVVEVHPELLGLHHHAGPAAEVAHQDAGAVADPLGLDVLVGGPAGLAECGGVEPALVGEGRHADVRIGGVGRQVHQLGHVPTHGGEPFEATLGQAAHAELQLEVGDAGHEVGVAGALAVAVHGSLELGGPAEHRRDRVRHRAAGVVLRVDAELLVGAEVGVHLGGDVLHLVRQRATVGVAHHEAVGPVRGGRLQDAQRELGVGLEAVEEVLGVEEHPQPGRLEELHALAHHGHALVEGGAQGIGDVEVPALAHDASGGGAGVHERMQRGVDIDLASRASGGAEGHQRGRLQVELVDRSPEELLVLGVGLRVAALDPRHAEPVELLGHLQLVLDGEGDALELRPIAQGRVEDLDGRWQRRVYWHSSTQSLYLSFWPRTTRPYSSPMAVVIGPGAGMERSSTEATALTSAAVPTTNISSATYRSLRVSSPKTTSKPMSLASWMTVSWVMPSRAPADRGGVMRRPWRATKMFSPVHSATKPCGFSNRASS